MLIIHIFDKLLKHLFMIMAHDEPKLLKKATNRLNSENHYFLINVDRKRDISPFCSLMRGNNFSFLQGEERGSVYHGAFSQVECEIQLLRKGLESSEEFDYFHLLSGHDYPCRDNSELDSFFEAHKGQSFMHYDTDEQHIEWKQKINDRVNKWYFKHDLIHNRYAAKGLRIIANLFLKRSYPTELYAGWQWFSWHRSLAEWVVNYVDKHPDFFQRFRYTQCCDEVMFHTLLHPYIEHLNIVKDNSLRYINWNKKVEGRKHKGSPLILNEEEYDEIIESGAFFCRKVDLMTSQQLLTLLENRIGNL